MGVVITGSEVSWIKDRLNRHYQLGIYIAVVSVKMNI